MSCYAFFQGWLLLSQPPHCLWSCTSFSTQLVLGTLANDPGSSPLDNGTSLSLSHSRRVRNGYSEFVTAWWAGLTPSPKRCSTPHPKTSRLPLKAFRREPAISVFGRLFTAIHRSSQGLATPSGSGLQPPFGDLHPAHGWLTRFRVSCQRPVL